MPFDQSSITEVLPPVWDASTLQIEWISTAPLGTVFQVYINRVLTWHGTTRWVAITMPKSQVRIDIGAVLPSEATTDFSALLPEAPSPYALLSWLGGSYLDPTGNDDVAGFRIYGASSPGGSIDMTAPLAEITAYPGGIITDGFGLGGFGKGGFGKAASNYSWTSGYLDCGVWSFAVVSVDAAGNAGAPAVTSVTISAPPRPPAAFADDSRLKYTYSQTTQTVTLYWQASPSA
jgi:hypothetical protein